MNGEEIFRRRFQPHISISEAPNFNKKQIQFLKSLVAHTKSSICCNTITVMCSEETIDNLYILILSVEDEMRERIKN